MTVENSFYQLLYNQRFSSYHQRIDAGEMQVEIKFWYPQWREAPCCLFVEKCKKNSWKPCRGAEIVSVCVLRVGKFNVQE